MYSIETAAKIKLPALVCDVHFDSIAEHGVTPQPPRHPPPPPHAVYCSLCVTHSSLQVRETSRKPDEMYSLLERLSPGTRKLEIFARPHNVQPGWVCLGNQLDGTKIADPEMLAAYTKAYGNPTTPKRQLPHQKD